jgi:serine/threonine protein kinase
MDKPNIPDYELEICCGSGAYGDVWIAKDRSGIKRAVKVLNKTRLNNLGVLDKEIRGLKLYRTKVPKHNQLVEIYHVGETDQHIFYVMDLADDIAPDKDKYLPDSMVERLKVKKRFTVEESVYLVEKMLDAVEVLHKAGLAHRDIKPGNIIYINGVPKLTDIGLVTTDVTGITLAGTMGFIPPERVSGAETDLYALGKLLYCLFTGNSPELFPSLSGALKDSLEAKQLNKFILQACNKNPAKRFKTVNEFRDALMWIGSEGKPIEIQLSFLQHFFSKTSAIILAICLFLCVVVLVFKYFDRLNNEMSAEGAEAYKEKHIDSLTLPREEELEIRKRIAEKRQQEVAKWDESSSGELKLNISTKKNPPSNKNVKKVKENVVPKKVDKKIDTLIKRTQPDASDDAGLKNKDNEIYQTIKNQLSYNEPLLGIVNENAYNSVVKKYGISKEQAIAIHSKKFHAEYGRLPPESAPKIKMDKVDLYTSQHKKLFSKTPFSYRTGKSNELNAKKEKPVKLNLSISADKIKSEEKKEFVKTLLFEELKPEWNSSIDPSSLGHGTLLVKEPLPDNFELDIKIKFKDNLKLPRNLPKKAFLNAFIDSTDMYKGTGRKLGVLSYALKIRKSENAKFEYLQRTKNYPNDREQWHSLSPVAKFDFNPGQWYNLKIIKTENYLRFYCKSDNFLSFLDNDVKVCGAKMMIDKSRFRMVFTDFDDYHYMDFSDLKVYSLSEKK